MFNSPPALVPENVTPHLYELILKFLKELENIKSCSPHTQRAYRRDLSQAMVGYTSLEQFLKELPQVQMRWKNLASASRNRKAASLKSFLRFLAEQGHCEDGASRQVISPKIHRKLPHFISVDEVLTVLQWLNRELSQPQSPAAQQGLRQKKALFMLLYGGGLRVSEACQLRRDEARPQDRILCIRGKGGKERLVALPRQAFAALVELAGSSDFFWGDSALSSRKAYAWIRQLGLDAGLLRPLHPHALRHSFATHLLSGGANLRSLQELLGHSSLVATQRYTQVSVDELGRTLELRHPLSRKPPVSP